jgi:hypothetical protein
VDRLGGERWIRVESMCRCSSDENEEFSRAVRRKAKVFTDVLLLENLARLSYRHPFM